MELTDTCRALRKKTLPSSGPQKNCSKTKKSTKGTDMMHNKCIFFGRIKSKSTLGSYTCTGNKKEHKRLRTEYEE